MEVWGSSQASSFSLDQQLFLVSLLLELPTEDGSEGAVLSSFFGRLSGVSRKPGKDKIPRHTGIWKWKGKTDGDQRWKETAEDTLC